LHLVNPTEFRLWGDFWKVPAGKYFGGTLYASYSADPSSFGLEVGQNGYVQVLMEVPKYPAWTLDGGFPYPKAGGWYASPWNNTLGKQ